jgi:glycosyltransferase involved in cell wall biosynthesis
MISVVIPAFNAGGFIRRAIDSVLSQTYLDYEIIVVDDGSTDNTAEVVKSYSSKVRYIYQKNAGDGPARNTGIAAAKGDWIAFLDHDDEWLPEKLQLQIDLLNRHPDLRWCAANYYTRYVKRQVPVGDVKLLSNVLGEKNYFDNFFTAVCKSGCALVTSTVIVHKEVFQKAGIFDSCWLCCADFDMWWRIAYQYPRIGYFAQPLVIMHLDVQPETNIRIHLRNTRAKDVLKLIARHLELAQQYGSMNEFKPLASQVLHRSLRTALFHGFRDDAREIVTRFRELFSWYMYYVVFLLTVSPGLTSVLMRTISYLRHLLRLESEITRPYSHSEVIRAANEDQT